ncbi:MAG: 5'-methylthioadenosine/S-adenosylhomocysteine nucleosidase [Candidatus Heteroscillospira sp.]|jgi:adenosylhomocysteine nucleosidase
MTGIFCAVEAEAAPILARLEVSETIEKNSLRFLRGKLRGREVCFVRGGMGKVNAAAAVQGMLDLFQPEALIISGVGGSLCPELRLMDLTLGVKCTHHDLPMAVIRADYPKMDSDWFYSDEKLARLAREVRPSLMDAVYLTGEAFIDSEGRESLVSRFGAEGKIACDMETAAVFQVCRAAKVPACCVRAISDTEEDCGLDVFWQNVAKASVLAADAVMDMVERI